MERTTSSTSAGIAGRFWYFVSTRYSPVKYLPYCLLWVASVQLLYARVRAGGAVPHSRATFPRSVVSAFLLFLFLRVVDEVKDLDFDRVHNPERAFPSGRVPLSDAPTYLLVIAAAVVAMNVGSCAALTLAVATMGYSLVLLYLERRFPAFGDTMFPNIALAVQLKTMAIACCVVWAADGGEVAWPLAAEIVAAHLFAYLHWEILRKIQWPGVGKQGERLYSDEAGVLGSFAIAGASMLTAVWLVWRMLGRTECSGGAWVALLPATWLLPAAWVLYRGRDRRNRAGLFGALGYLSFLSANVVFGLRPW